MEKSMLVLTASSTTVVISGKYSRDGKSHECLVNTTWFVTRRERDAFTKRFYAVAQRQERVNGRTLYAAETLAYLD